MLFHNKYLEKTNFVCCPDQVHSLTARSVSREFREGLRLSHPSPPNMNIKVTPKVPSKENSSESKLDPHNEVNETESPNTTNEKDRFKNRQNAEGESSDSEKNLSSSNDVLTSSNLNKAKRSGSKSILSRAAFWDKRVKDGIIQDEVAIKEFPKVEGIAD